MVPAEFHRGGRHTLVPMECPKTHPPAGPFISRVLEDQGRAVSASKPISESRIRTMDRRRTQLSLHLDSFTAISLYFSHCILGAQIWLFLATFHPLGLGKACFLSSQTNPAQRGQDGTTSFGKLAPSRSIESWFLSDQASSLKFLEIPIHPLLSCFLKAVLTPTLPPLPGLTRGSFPKFSASEPSFSCVHVQKL